MEFACKPKKLKAHPNRKFFSILYGQNKNVSAQTFTENFQWMKAQKLKTIIFDGLSFFNFADSMFKPSISYLY